MSLLYQQFYKEKFMSKHTIVNFLRSEQFDEILQP